MYLWWNGVVRRLYRALCARYKYKEGDDCVLTAACFDVCAHSLKGVSILYVYEDVWLTFDAG